MLPKYDATQIDDLCAVSTLDIQFNLHIMSKSNIVPPTHQASKCKGT